MGTDDTGIGLLVFDRPEHTKRVLNGLERNDIEKLYVFADGPKPDSDIETIRATRDVVREIDFCEVDYTFRSENIGLKQSWISAYDYIFDSHEKAIMLENDCVPAGDFVQYMRACLDRYENEKRVMNIHGYTPPIEIPESYPYDIFFTWRSGSHGQGTWKDAWQEFDEDPALLDRIKEEQPFRAKVERAGEDLESMLRRDIEGEIDSVAVWWSLTLIRNNGVSINPINSRIKNIGHDGSGRHSVDSDRLDVGIEETTEFDGLSFPPKVKVDEKLHSMYLDYMLGGKRSTIERAKKVYREGGLFYLVSRTTNRLLEIIKKN